MVPLLLPVKVCGLAPDCASPVTLRVQLPEPAVPPLSLTIVMTTWIVARFGGVGPGGVDGLTVGVGVAVGCGVWPGLRVGAGPGGVVGAAVAAGPAVTTGVGVEVRSRLGSTTGPSVTTTPALSRAATVPPAVEPIATADPVGRGRRRNAERPAGRQEKRSATSPTTSSPGSGSSLSPRSGPALPGTRRCAARRAAASRAGVAGRRLADADTLLDLSSLRRGTSSNPCGRLRPRATSRAGPLLAHGVAAGRPWRSTNATTPTRTSARQNASTR